MNALLRRSAIPAVTTAVCAAVGLAIPLNEQVAVTIAFAAVGVCAFAAPTAAWVASAVIAALTFRALSTLGILPEVAAYFDIPLAWGALLVALSKRRPVSPGAARHLRVLLLLLAAVAMSWLFNLSEVLRPVAYAALLAAPFAVVGALLLDPPTRTQRRLLVNVAAALAAVQVPLMYGQYFAFGGGDRMQGTLYGAGGGAHLTSAILLLSCVWYFTRDRGDISWRSLAALIPVLVLPILADAKQVVAVMPAVALAWTRHGSRSGWFTRAALGGVVATVLFLFVPAAHTGLAMLKDAQSANKGKVAETEFVWARISADPASLVFGKGPAETVSRAAFLTTNYFGPSPLHVLGLRPARVPLEAEAKVASNSNVVSGSSGRFVVGSSINSALSSALGILGDLGVLGVLVYGTLYLTVVRDLYRSTDRLASPAMAGWIMFAILGFLFDWWEQPPFALFVALLSGLALAPQRDVPVVPRVEGYWRPSSHVRASVTRST